MIAIREKAFQLQNELDLPIRCDLRLPEGSGPFPVVVILHGFKGFKDWGMFPPTARHLAENGIASVALNASMNGVGEKLEEFTELDKFAKNTPRREARDLERVMEAILSGEVPGSIDSARMGLLGHSRGGGVVTLVASRNSHIRCVVTWSSISKFHRYTERAVESWRRKGRLDVPNLRTGQVLWLDRSVLEDLLASREEYDLRRACARIEVPFLVIHGERDEAVATEDARNLHDWIASKEKRLTIVPQAGHTFGAAHPWAGAPAAWRKVVDETTEWFARWLERPSGAS